MAAFQKAQDQLRGALSRLLVANEAYPDLKANAQFHDLSVQLEGTENRILRSREQYNEAVRDYNTELGKIRGAVVKRATGGTFKPRVYFQASSDAPAGAQGDLLMPSRAWGPLCATLLLLVAGPAGAFNVPKQTDYVTDTSGTLGAAELTDLDNRSVTMSGRPETKSSSW